jgi:hypothetical protein
MPGGKKYWSNVPFDASEAVAAADATAKVLVATGAEDKIVNTEILLGTNTNVGFVVVPVAGEVVAIYSAVDGVLTTANEVLSFAVTGGTTMGDITIAYSGSAAGDVDTLAPSANNAVVAGDTIDVTTDGGNATTTTIATITVLIRDA